jgi:uncharacterized repeat protein (TIGR01451 family)
MKKYLLLFACMLLFHNSIAQLTKWSKSVGAFDAVDAATDQWGNIYSLATGLGGLVIDGNTLYTPIVNDHFVIVLKHDRDGNLLWFRCFEASINGANATALAVDPSGDIYIGGTAGMVAVNLDTVTVFGSFIARLDQATGNVKWAQPVPQQFYSMVLDKSGNVYPLFTSNSSAYFGTSWVVNNWGVGNGIGVGKFDPNGNVVWVSLFRSYGTGRGSGIAIDSSGATLVFTGYFTTQFDVNASSVSSTSMAAFVGSISTSNGSTAGLFKTGGKTGVDVKFNHSGDVIVAGEFANTVSIGSNTLTAHGMNDLYLASFSVAGTCNFAKQIGSIGNNSQNLQMGNIGIDSSDQIFMDGQLPDMTIFGSDTLPGMLGMQYGFLAKFDATGNELWENEFTCSTNCRANGMFVEDNGMMVITGNYGNNANLVIGTDTLYGGGIFISFIAGDANLIKGRMYFDFNKNGIYDSGDRGLKNEKALISPAPYPAFADVDGNYEMFVDTGNFLVTPGYSNSYYNLLNASYPVTFSSYNQLSSNLDFVFQPISGITDVKVDVTSLSPSRTYQPMYFQITCTNAGTDTASGEVKFFFDPGFNYLYSMPLATFSGDTVVWPYSNLKPFESLTFEVMLFLTTSIPVGSVISSIAYITPYANDVKQSDNSDTLTSIVVASLDPNYKEVEPAGNIAPSFIPSGDLLDYTVHFQNTGTDTAFTIVVVDTISNNLDLNSLEIISSSHPVTLYATGNGRVEFTFTNILLPDSNVDEPLSHGFVKYSIRPLGTLANGDSISNTGYIYFDYNAPVITNTTITKVTNLNALPELNDSHIKIYPVPSSDNITVDLTGFSNEKINLKLFTLKGNLIREWRNIQPQLFKIDMQHVDAGSYLLVVHSGKANHYCKIVKTGE